MASPCVTVCTCTGLARVVQHRVHRTERAKFFNFSLNCGSRVCGTCVSNVLAYTYVRLDVQSAGHVSSVLVLVGFMVLFQ